MPDEKLLRRRRVVAERVLRAPGIDLELSPEFMECLLPRPREKLITGGPQGGKSTNGAADVYIDWWPLDASRRHLYWVIVPSYKSPRKEMEYLRDWAASAGVLGETHFPTNDSASISCFGGLVRVETKTGQDPEGISGEPCDGILVVEAGQQPEIVREKVHDRLTTYRGWATYTGTIERDDIKPMWAWYARLAEEWRGDRNDEHGAWSLPTWANLRMFPGGRSDPEMLRLEAMYDPMAFQRKYAAQVTGVPNPVYPQLAMRGYLVPIPPGHDNWIWSKGAGGEDYGSELGHPSALSVITVNDLGEAWVRESWKGQTGDTRAIDFRRLEMGAVYNIRPERWGLDPMLKAHADYLGVEAVASGAGSRLARAGLVHGLLNNVRTGMGLKLFFDLNGPGVPGAYAEMARVHYVKRLVAGRGEVYDYSRTDDDMTATIENAVELLEHPTRNPWSGWEAQKGLSTPGWLGRKVRLGA